ncbi:Lrp/AsnC family transcriptional regulator [Primorskyibacter sp. S187A]|uniref:siroheme decarboxylase subunit beta n=1 Tax=Primorskyibacter sp. S187A TaxID=3415130 RepID=UPI003C7C5E1E
MNLSSIERDVVTACQAGLPFVPRPYEAIAEKLGMDEQAVIDLMAKMMSRGAIRRIGIAPNHYKLGMTSNGMSVWDVDDAHVHELGPLVGAMEAVTHCYIRPRALPDWRFNLFAMVHGSSRDEVEEKRGRIADLLGDACAASDILYSTAILKKTGLRLRKTEK